MTSATSLRAVTEPEAPGLKRLQMVCPVTARLTARVVLARILSHPAGSRPSAGTPTTRPFKGRALLDYLAGSQDTQPVIIVMRAWVTEWIGFLQDDGFDRRRAAEAAGRRACDVPEHGRA